MIFAAAGVILVVTIVVIIACFRATELFIKVNYKEKNK